MLDKKLYTIRRLVAVAMAVALALAFLVHCSGEQSVQSKGQRLEVRMKLASSDMAHLIVSVRITVVPEGGGEPIIVMLPVVNGQYAGIIAGVPVGTATVITEALDESGRVVYRGEETVVVTAGEPSEVEVTLEPFGMMIRFTPRYLVNPGGEPFTLDVEVFNIPELNHVSFRVHYPAALVRPDSAHPGSSIQDGQTIFFDLHDTLSSDPPYYAFGISSTSPSDTLVDANGYANLARLFFSAGIPGIPIEALITIDSVVLHNIDGIAIDMELTYRDRCVVTFTGIAVDVIAPFPIIDLAIDSLTQTAAFLSWTAPGDDGMIGTVDGYEIRHSSAPITQLNWAAAELSSTAPVPVAPGGKQTLAVYDLDMTVPTYFAVRAVDDAGNWSLLSNAPLGEADDITAPGAVFDLAITDQTTSSITLGWTAVGDNGVNGTAAEYDIRLYTDSITAVNWDLATTLSGEPTPQAAGATETMTISLQHSQTVYIAMRVGDEIPNWSPLSNVVRSTPPDTTAPSAISDLVTIEIGGTSITLQWTAPGNDGQTGTASAYDIRYDTDPISEASFGAATVVSAPPTPQAAGTVESFSVSGLNSETQYYFAVKAADDVPNWSSLSNSAPGMTTDITPPGAITDLTVLDYTEATATLTWTAPGDNDYIGTPVAYDLRWSDAIITDANWALANIVTGVTTPGIAGTTETWTVIGLPTIGAYYFAIKTSDEVGNLSSLSNAAMLVMQVVVFPDAVLDTEVRRIIGKPSGTIVAPELAPVDSIDVDDLGVFDLTGLEYCTNLRFAQLSWNQISDLSPISGLVSLRHLAAVDIPISNVNAVAGLSGLEYLDVSRNPWLTDFSPILDLTGLDTLIMDHDSLTEMTLVASLDSLNYLSAAYNSITDLTPVANLSLLEYINVSYNEIVDISALQPVRSLDTIRIAGNSVSDLLPLVQNIGLGANDYVDVTGNPLSEEAWYNQIPALEDRQVTVITGGR